MNINFNLKNTLKRTREQYVKEFKVSGEIKIEPCDKFVACLEKLSKNYVLALRDNANIETLQIANQKDIEFYEGYEIVPQYTDDLRRQLCHKLTRVNQLLARIITTLSEFDKWVDVDNKTRLNDTKLELNVIKRIVNNIFQHLTMTDNDAVESVENNAIKDKVEMLISDLIKLIEMLIDIKSKMIIDYMVKQLDVIIYKILNFVNVIKDIFNK